MAGEMFSETSLEVDEDKEGMVGQTMKQHLTTPEMRKGQPVYVELQATLEDLYNGRDLEVYRFTKSF